MLAQHLPQSDADHEYREQQQHRVDRAATAAQLHGVGIAEQGRTADQATGTPVAEDHGSQADIATPTSLSVAVDVGSDEGEVTTTEAGQRAGDQHGNELVLVDVDAQRLCRDRTLTCLLYTSPSPRDGLLS